MDKRDIALYILGSSIMIHNAFFGREEGRSDICPDETVNTGTATCQAATTNHNVQVCNQVFN